MISEPTINEKNITTLINELEFADIRSFERSSSGYNDVKNYLFETANDYLCVAGKLHIIAGDFYKDKTKCEEINTMAVAHSIVGHKYLILYKQY